MSNRVQVNVLNPDANVLPSDDESAENVSNEEQTIVVPNTGVNSFESMINGEGAQFFVGGAIILIVFAIAVIIKRRFEKSGKEFSRKMLGLGLLMLAVVSGAISFMTLKFSNGELSEATAIEDDESSDTLSISADDIDIDVIVKDEKVYASADSKVIVNAGTRFGYTLGVYADKSELVNEEDEKNKILAVNNENPGRGILRDNNWGFALEEPLDQNSTVWYGMPNKIEDAVTLKEVHHATSGGDETTLHYGVYATPDLAYGTYAGSTINYVAVANVIDPEIMFVFSGEDVSFDEAGAVTTNTVGYARVCENEGEDIWIGTDCDYTNVLGEYKQPFSRNGKTLASWYLHVEGFDGGVDLGIGEEELLWNLNDGMFEGLEGRTIFADAEVVKEFTITYDANGGEFIEKCKSSGDGGMTKSTVPSTDGCPSVGTVSIHYLGDGEPFGVNVNYEPRNGSMFLAGWSRDPNAISPEYWDGETITSEFDSDVTLYAIWENGTV